jgi:hypothetical protein
MAILKTIEVLAKITECRGNLAAVGRALGVTRQSVHAFVHKHPTLRAAVADCREAMIDHAESALHRAIFQGEAWAVCFFLKTQGRRRGYSERLDVGRPEDLTDDELAAIAARGRPRAAPEEGTPGGGAGRDGPG